MDITLVDYTGKHAPCGAAHYAAAMLVFAKSTRLEMKPEGLDCAIAKRPGDLCNELEAIANTIPSCWEFVDYTFFVQNVTRAFTHQLVRTRTASFAQQTMRVLDVSEGRGWDYAIGPSVAPANCAGVFDDCMAHIGEAYDEMIASGVAIEDARGVLPTNILTNILVKMNMRTFVELVRKRSSSRVQGEYRDFIKLLSEKIKEVHPWIVLFIERDFDTAARELDKAIRHNVTDREISTRMIKLLDQMRMP